MNMVAYRQSDDDKKNSSPLSSDEFTRLWLEAVINVENSTGYAHLFGYKPAELDKRSGIISHRQLPPRTVAIKNIINKIDRQDAIFLCLLASFFKKDYTDILCKSRRIEIKLSDVTEISSAKKRQLFSELIINFNKWK